MSQQEIRIFENNNIRAYWDEDREQWFFCINDVVLALTDSKDVKQYIKRLRQREPELNSVWGTICTPHQFISTDGKRHMVNCSNVAGILVERKGKYGKFIGCTNYPNCRYTDK